MIPFLEQFQLKIQTNNMKVNVAHPTNIKTNQNNITTSEILKFKKMFQNFSITFCT